jgi:23S rRNA (uracil1939-C5)-methyltransferase
VVVSHALVPVGVFSSGPEFLREPLPVGDKGWLYFTPLTFRQGNMDGFEILANDVARRVPQGSKVCELYAGVGLLGLTAFAFHASADGGLKWLRCSDENPANARCFQRAVDSL